MEKNLTTGSVFGNIVRFSLPYLLSYFLQTLYGMADLFIIGQYEGVASTTAVSIGSQVMHMLTVMIVGLAMGATVTIGQAVGARDRRGAAGYIGNTTTLFLALSVVLTGLLLALARPIAAVMSTPAEAVPGTVAYLRICFLGVPLITAYNIIASIFRGLGDSKRPMYFIAIACAANIALDYLFMGALHMGPAGAALGTTLAQAVSVVVSLLVIRRERDGIALTRGDFRPRRAVMGRILRIGVPVALQDGLIQIAFLFITVIANRRGLTDAAAVGIVEKIISFLFLVPSSMLSTVSALGRDVGARLGLAAHGAHLRLEDQAGDERDDARDHERDAQIAQQRRRGEAGVNVGVMAGAVGIVRVAAGIGLAAEQVGAAVDVVAKALVPVVVAEVVEKAVLELLQGRVREEELCLVAVDEGGVLAVRHAQQQEHTVAPVTDAERVVVVERVGRRLHVGKAAVGIVVHGADVHADAAAAREGGGALRELADLLVGEQAGLVRDPVPGGQRRYCERHGQQQHEQQGGQFAFHIRRLLTAGTAKLQSAPP